MPIFPVQICIKCSTIRPIFQTGSDSILERMRLMKWKNFYLSGSVIAPTAGRGQARNDWVMHSPLIDACRYTCFDPTGKSSHRLSLAQLNRSRRKQTLERSHDSLLPHAVFYWRMGKFGFVAPLLGMFSLAIGWLAIATSSSKAGPRLSSMLRCCLVRWARLVIRKPRVAKFCCL